MSPRGEFRYGLAPMPRTRTRRATEDGRVVRGERNRDRIVAAVVELVRSGNPQPSADQIAAAAGTGTRTVFRQFADLEQLFTAVYGRVQSEIAPLVDPSPIAGTVAARARELVRRRARIYERLRPFRLSATPHRGRSAVVQRGHRSLDDWNRAQLLATFAPELRSAAPEVVELLDALTSFETWERLRRAQRLAVARTCAVVEHGIVALVAPRTRPARGPVA